MMPIYLCAVIGVILSIVECQVEPDIMLSLMLHNLVLRMTIGIIIVLLARCSKGNFGEGDGYIIACLGLLLGIRALIEIIIIASIIGFCVSIIILIMRHTNNIKSTIPYVPILLAAYMIEIL